MGNAKAHAGSSTLFHWLGLKRTPLAASGPEGLPRNQDARAGTAAPDWALIRELERTTGQERLLGSASDTRIAHRLGRTRAAVRERRRLLGILAKQTRDALRKSRKPAREQTDFRHTSPGR